MPASTTGEIENRLQSLGTNSYKSILCNHGVNEPVFGVKIEELKKFQKRIKKDYQLKPKTKPHAKAPSRKEIQGNRCVTGRTVVGPLCLPSNSLRLSAFA